MECHYLWHTSARHASPCENLCFQCVNSTPNCYQHNTRNNLHHSFHILLHSSSLFSQILSPCSIPNSYCYIYITPVIVVAMLIAEMSQPALFSSVVIPFLWRAIIPRSLGSEVPVILGRGIVLTIVAIISNNLQIFSLSSTVAPLVIGINIAPGILVSVLAAGMIISACSSVRINILLSGTVSPSTVGVTPIVAFAVFLRIQ